LFAVIGGVLVLWWLHPPNIPTGQQIAQGDLSLSGIAREQATPVDVLLPSQAQGSSDDPLPPTPTLAPTPEPTSTPQPTPTMPAGPVRHTVKKGDTVDAIARLYGSTTKDIIQANGLGADARLAVGQELIVPVAGPMGGQTLDPTATPSGGALVYTVQPGDTISDIAVRLHSQIDWILKANNLSPTDYIHIGQPLTVPLSVATSTAVATVAVTPQTPTATPKPELRAPVLLSPPDAAIVSGQDAAVLSWASVGILGSDEWYVVTLRAGERNVAPVMWWTKGTLWRLPADYRGNSQAGVDFTWQVQVRKGSSEQPGEPISPASVERRFTWQ